MRLGTNYVMGASRDRRNLREVIANRRWLQGRRLDGNPIGRIRLAYFVAHGRDGRVIGCTLRVLDVIAPRWLLYPPPIFVFLGPFDHRSQKTRIRSSSGVRSVYAPRCSFRELAIRRSAFPRGMFQTRRWPGSRRWGSIRFSGAICAPPRILSLSSRRSSN